MGKVVHFEISADDVTRAQKFYKTVFDWVINPMPDMEYTIVHTGPTNVKDGMAKEIGFINGGMMKKNDLIKSPVITIDVADIDACAKLIVRHGGSMLGDIMVVGDMGWAAYFKDSEGNIMGLWQNK